MMNEYFENSLNYVVTIGGTAYRITKGATMGAMKVISVVDKLQWRGKASLSHFHRLAGSHTGYLSIDTQDPAILKDIEKRFKRYGVLYAELPDLNNRDGQRQYVYNADQVSGVQAMVNDYNRDRLNRLQEIQDRYGKGTDRYETEKRKLEQKMPSIRSMTAEDYARTRYDRETRRETRAYEYMDRSVRQKEQEKQEQEKAMGTIHKQEQKKQAEKTEKAVTEKAKEEMEKDLKKKSLWEKIKKLKTSTKFVVMGGLLAADEVIKVSFSKTHSVVVQDPKTGKNIELNAFEIPGAGHRIGLLPQTAVVSKGVGIIARDAYYYVVNGEGPVERLLGDDLIKAIKESPFTKGYEKIKEASRERQKETRKLVEAFEVERKKGRSR